MLDNFLNYINKGSADDYMQCIATFRQANNFAVVLSLLFKFSIYGLLLINGYWSSPSDQICSNLYGAFYIGGKTSILKLDQQTRFFLF